jgi:hypothetical protein
MSKLSKRHRLKVSSLIWTRHDELPVCVVRVVGDGVDEMLEELWNSGHPVINVIHFAEPKEKPPAPPKPIPLEPFYSQTSDTCGLYPST